MANHKSAEQRIRNSARKRERNRYQKVTEKNAVKAFHELKDKKEATTKLPKLMSMVDRLAKKNIIHKNKAAHVKAQLSKHVNSL